MNGSLTLSDIFAREIAVEWFEAVALVRDVADRVRDNLGGQSVPDLDQIELLEDGQVRLSGAIRTDEPVRRLGQLLQAVLVQADPPVQLRLTASQATAPTPAFATIREYDEAVAYYERPDRRSVLQALYARAATAPAGMASSSRSPHLDEIAPLEHQQANTSGTATPDRPRTKLRAIPAVVGGIVLFVASAAFWYQWAAGRTDLGVSKLAITASDAVGSALVAGVSKVSDAAGLGRLAPADSAATPAAPPVSSRAAVTPARGSRQAIKAGPMPFRVFDLGPGDIATVPVRQLPDTASPEAIPVPSAEPENQSDGLVYSATDGDVTPPIGVRPQLPAVLPADVRKEQLGRIELTILSDGTVGAVKLLGERHSVPEAMLLSAAKAWTFTPATKHGRPVAYKKIVWLALR